MTNIRADREQITEFCKKNHIRKFSLFGSVLRDDFRPDSDIDILVEFEPDFPVGFIRFAAMERELSALYGRRADLHTPAELSRHFRDDVLRSAKVQYAEA